MLFSPKNAGVCMEVFEYVPEKWKMCTISSISRGKSNSQRQVAMPAHVHPPTSV